MYEIEGRVVFDPPNKTRKHERQSEWKRVAMINIGGPGLCDLYAWMINRRYSVELVRPLRGGHLTFVNDRASDITGETDAERDALWAEVSDRLNGELVSVQVVPDPRTNGSYWWLQVGPDTKRDLTAVRSTLGLGYPHFGFHITVGEATLHRLPQSEYVHRSILGGFMQ